MHSYLTVFQQKFKENSAQNSTKLKFGSDPDFITQHFRDFCSNSSLVARTIFGEILLNFAIEALFVFSIDGPKQNARSLLTAVSDTVFHGLSHDTLSFAFHGSFKNHSFQGI